MNLNFPPKLNLKLSITEKRYKTLLLERNVANWLINVWPFKFFSRTRQFFTIWDLILAGNSNPLLTYNNLPLKIWTWRQGRRTRNWRANLPKISKWWWILDRKKTSDLYLWHAKMQIWICFSGQRMKWSTIKKWWVVTLFRKPRSKNRYPKRLRGKLNFCWFQSRLL